jgi:hypothetical protein
MPPSGVQVEPLELLAVLALLADELLELEAPPIPVLEDAELELDSAPDVQLLVPHAKAATVNAPIVVNAKVSGILRRRRVRVLIPAPYRLDVTTAIACALHPHVGVAHEDVLHPAMGLRRRRARRRDHERRVRRSRTP